MYQCEREIVMRWSYKELRRNPLCANFNEVVDALVRLATAEWWSYPEEGPTANRQPPAASIKIRDTCRSVWRDRGKPPGT